jgi:hypothetical protein
MHIVFDFYRSMTLKDVKWQLYNRLERVFCLPIWRTCWQIFVSVEASEVYPNLLNPVIWVEPDKIFVFICKLHQTNRHSLHNRKLGQHPSVSLLSRPLTTLFDSLVMLLIE